MRVLNHSPLPPLTPPQLTFYTMCKSITPLFLLAFAIALGLERASLRLCCSIGAIVAGVTCAVAGETAFNATGFALVLCAAAVSGMRWALTQRLMRRHCDSGLGHPLGLMYRLLPIMCAASLLTSLACERLAAVLPRSPFFHSRGAACETLALICCAALLAFGMTLAEFSLMRLTSAVTLSVAGTVKEAVSVLVYMLIDGDRVGPLNALGLALVLAGVGAYNSARAHDREAHKAEQAVEGGAGGGEGDRGGYQRLVDLEAAPGARAQPQRARASAQAGLEVQPLSEAESYSSILNALLANKTR